MSNISGHNAVSLFNNDKEEKEVSYISSNLSIKDSIESAIESIIKNFNENDHIRFILSFLDSYNRHHEDDKITPESLIVFNKNNIELLDDFPLDELKDCKSKEDKIKVYDTYNHKIFCLMKKYMIRIDYKIIPKE